MNSHEGEYFGEHNKYMIICKKCGRAIVVVYKNGDIPKCGCGNEEDFVETNLLSSDYMKLLEYAVQHPQNDIYRSYRLKQYIKEKYCYPCGEYDPTLPYIEWNNKFTFGEDYKNHPEYIKYQTYGIDWQEFESILNPPKYVPTCPTCGSPNIQKISSTSKATNTILFGIFGTKRHKTFKCLNCKYEW